MAATILYRPPKRTPGPREASIQVVSCLLDVIHPCRGAIYGPVSPEHISPIGHGLAGTCMAVGELTHAPTRTHKWRPYTTSFQARWVRAQRVRATTRPLGEI